MKLADEAGVIDPFSDTQVVLRWDVSAELIDIDTHAAVYMAARRQIGRRSIPRLYWLVVPICTVVLALVTSLWFFLAGAIMLLPCTNLIYRLAAKNMARNLRRIPAAHEPYWFVATASGTDSSSPSASQHIEWPRYTEVMEIEDSIVLVTDTPGLMIVLPNSVLTTTPPGLGPEDAATTMRRWLQAADRWPTRSGDGVADLEATTVKFHRSRLLWIPILVALIVLVFGISTWRALDRPRPDPFADGTVHEVTADCIWPMGCYISVGPVDGARWQGYTLAPVPNAWRGRSEVPGTLTIGTPEGVSGAAMPVTAVFTAADGESIGVSGG